MLESKTIEWDANDRLAGDLQCVSCGYNLRGLERSGVCGECGVSVKCSLAGSYLYHCDPAWVRQLRVGAACLTLTLPWVWLPPAWLAFGYGMWCLSAPDPAAIPKGGLLRLTILRLLLAALPLVSWFAVVPLCVTYWHMKAQALKFNPGVATCFLLGGFFLLAPPLAALVIRRIAVRADSKPMIRRVSYAFWLGGMSLSFVGAWCANELAGLNLDLLIVLGVVGVFLGLLAYVYLAAGLFVTWRVLEQAEAQTNARHTQVRYWQSRQPGSGRLGEP